MSSSYPPAQRQGDNDAPCARAVPDPYRWLEEGGSKETLAWQASQDHLWTQFRSKLDHLDYFTKHLYGFSAGWVGLPVWRADTAFFTRRRPDQEHAVLVRNTTEDEFLSPELDTVILDPLEIDPSGKTTLDLWSPSWDGRFVAWVTSHGGEEQGLLHITEVQSGREIQEPVNLGRGPDLVWLKGSEELLYVRRPFSVPEGQEQLHRRVWRHRVGSSPSTDTEVLGQGHDPRTYFGLNAQDSGDQVVISASIGTAPRNDLWLFDPHPPPGDAELKILSKGLDALTYGHIDPGGRIWLLTNHKAPRWRLATVQQATGNWLDILPESDDPLVDFAVARDTVVAVRTHDVTSQVTIHDSRSGAILNEVHLPGNGSVSLTESPGKPGHVWLSYGSSLTPRSVYLLDTQTAALRLWSSPENAPQAPAGSWARRHFAISADGTSIPYEVIGRTGQQSRYNQDGNEDLGGTLASQESPRPAILYGYGGFGVSLGPEWSSRTMAWIQAGGLWINANLRGGSEYGEQWHQSGMRENKQRVFEDFEAVAQDLISRKYTDASRLGIEGGSNGGLLVGAALVRKTELFRAVVCSAPLLDMVRYELFGLGITWNDEYGSAQNATELDWLLSYSPYHHVVAGTEYPAVLFTVFDGDTRVDPLHARKMCAALQWASAAPFEHSPILIRREVGVGHSSRALSRTVELTADTAAFMAAQLGLNIDPPPTS